MLKEIDSTIIWFQLIIYDMSFDKVLFRHKKIKEIITAKMVVDISNTNIQHAH